MPIPGEVGRDTRPLFIAVTDTKTIGKEMDSEEPRFN